MNREILFRGLDYFGNWQEGNLAVVSNGTCWIDNLIVRVKVKPDSVGQFTGFKTLSGQRIFDGQKFRYNQHDGYLYDNFEGEFVFEHGSFGFKVLYGGYYRAFTPFCDIDELQHDFLNHIELLD
jgi:hypothetical protein